MLACCVHSSGHCEHTEALFARSGGNRAREHEGTRLGVQRANMAACLLTEMCLYCALFFWCMFLLGSSHLSSLWAFPLFGLVSCFVLLQDYILAIPDDRYTPDLLKEKPLDQSSDFIAQCGGESFQIEYEHSTARLWQLLTHFIRHKSLTLSCMK